MLTIAENSEPDFGNSKKIQLSKALGHLEEAERETDCDLRAKKSLDIARIIEDICPAGVPYRHAFQSTTTHESAFHSVECPLRLTTSSNLKPMKY